MLGQASQGLTFTAFTPGLPQMAQSFAGTGHGMEIAQQTVTIAALGVIAGAFLSGKIVDIAGPRVTILTSLLLYGLRVPQDCCCMTFGICSAAGS